MGRANYGKVGGSGRRSGAAFQWIVIGGVLGFSCPTIIGLTLLILGVVTINPNPNTTAFISTNTPQVVVTDAVVTGPTPDIQATVNAGVAIAIEQTRMAQPQPTPTNTLGAMVALPSPTPQQPLQPVTSVTDQPLPSPTSSTGDGTVGQPVVPQNNTPLSTPTTTIPEPLAVLASTMVVVEGGTFNMGTTAQEVRQAVEECVTRDGAQCTVQMGEDSVPPHPVTVSTFQIETTEVTYRQYITFLNYLGPNSHRRGCLGQPCLNTTSEDANSYVTFDSQNYEVSTVFNEFPVVNVTWYGALAYCQALGRRLPTEAEWERAARGPGIDGFIYPWGNTWDGARARTRNTGQIGALEVRSFASGASPFGVLNMAGNVAEWVNDWYGPNYYSLPEASGVNPQGPAIGTDRVVRGGSWDTRPFFVRTVHRQHFRPDETSLDRGFRCAADYTPIISAPVTNTNNSIGSPNIGPQLPPTNPPVIGQPGLPTQAPNPTAIPVAPPGG